MEKIVIALDAGAWHGFATERVWAERISDGRFRIRNVPFYARGISVEDIVNTESRDGSEVVTGVSIRAGHSTYRIFMSEEASVAGLESTPEWAKLSALGCTYERGTKRLFAIDVPARASIKEVVEALSEGERDGVWDFQEGDCGQRVIRSKS